MDSQEENFNNPNILANMIRQKQLMGSFGGGLPSAMPEPQNNAPQSPDLTVHHLVGTIPQPNVPKIGPIDPNSEQPAESAYKQSLMNEPMHSDYHPTKLRNVLSQIAGVATGAFNGGPEGARVMAGIRDAPFNQQHQDWSQITGNREKLANEEIAGNAAGQKALTDQALINERNSTADKNIREVKLMRNTPDEVRQDKIDEAQGRLKTDTREAKMLDGTVKHLVQRNGLFYDPETNARVDRSAIEDISDEGKSLKETKQSRIPGNLGQAIQAKKILAEGTGGENKYDQATVDAAKEYDAKLSRGDEPTGAFNSTAATMEKELGRPLTSKERIKLTRDLQPDQKPPQMLMVDPNTNKAVNIKPGSDVPEGASTPVQMGANVAKNAAEQKSLKEDQDFVNDYLNNQTHTGPGDEALLERFFNVTKPSTGFRMNQAQIALLTKLRSFSSTVKAFMAHQTGGTLFDDKQRREIADTINQITSSKLGTKSDTLPGGISIQDIDAEIARRKGAK